jgi:hypothetical protein
MPLTSARRFAAAGTLAFLSSRAALAEEPTTCAPHGPLQTYVAPNEQDPTLARRTLDQIVSELEKRTLECPARAGEPIELAVTWRTSDHVLVRLSTRTSARELSVERLVDLGRVPADEIPLAVAIIADEMFAEVLERAAAVVEPSPPQRPPPQKPPVRATPRALGASAPPAFRFGLRATYQELTTGLGLTGFDAEVAWIVVPNFQLAARGGVRAASWTGAPRAPGNGYDVSALALVGTSAYAPYGIAAAMGLDILGLGDAARASPALGVYAWQKLDRRFSLSLDVRIGGIFSDPTEFSALAGACVSVSVGIATEW